MKRPFSFYLLAIVLLFQGVCGMFGGVSLIHDSTGAGLGMNVPQLHSVFANFFIPGLVLALLLGVLPTLLFFVLILKPNWHWPNRFNLFRNQFWGWTFSLYVGIILIIWIDVQLMIVQEYIILQPVFSLVGLSIVVLALWPSSQKYFLRF